MTLELAPTQLSQIDHTALKQAVKSLENPNFAARLADYAGIPVNRVLGILPKVANNQLSALVRSAVMKSLDVAIDTLEDEPPPTPATWFSSFLAGVTGGVSGLVGFAALPVELPLTTTFMLRAIAAIARHEGEDLSKIEARLACLEVFALGTKRNAADRCRLLRRPRALEQIYQPTSSPWWRNAVPSMFPRPWSEAW